MKAFEILVVNTHYKEVQYVALYMDFVYTYTCLFLIFGYIHVYTVSEELMHEV